ncbi:hypothetical protein [Allohahella marinimesophila]|uniref:Uncharacterized protein n=1 Tax=Allohahella marinimesophila TaxID=1054972 RepID=A0ABP7PH61_9GAMM
MTFERLKPGHPAHLVLGLVIWSVWFVLLYGGLSVACELAPPGAEQGALNWLNATLLVLGVFFFVMLLAGAYMSWRHAPSAESDQPQQRFLGRVAAAVYLFAAIASLAIAVPSLVMPPCL